MSIIPKVDTMGSYAYSNIAINAKYIYIFF